MFQFTEDCMIGISQIDEEHKMLFQLLNEAAAVAETGTPGMIGKNLLQKLEDYATTHFAHEEAYMEQIKDPELARQKQEHRQFAETVERYQTFDWESEQAAEKVKELLSFMAKWLYHHILGSDIMIGRNETCGQGEDAFAFTDQYRTGIGLIDEEHRRLFEIIRQTNDVIEAQFLHDKYDEIVQILKELKDYTILHFRDEEEYMERIGYEGIAMQRAAHTAFVDRLNEINLDDVDDNQKEYLEEILSFLLGWLTNHILKMDKKIPVERPADA